MFAFGYANSGNIASDVGKVTRSHQKVTKDIFLDELDRCRPDFSVRTIERVKHFFDAPGVIFVLLLNRTQLAAAVEGLYGPKVDAEAYLSKFIPLSLILPKRTCVDRSGNDDNLAHCKSELSRFGFPITDSHNAFATMLGIYASTFGLSLRDVERAVILYSFAQPINHSCSAVAWPIAIRLYKPDLYKRIATGLRASNARAHFFWLASPPTSPAAPHTARAYHAPCWPASSTGAIDHR